MKPKIIVTVPAWADVEVRKDKGMRDIMSINNHGYAEACVPVLMPPDVKAKFAADDVKAAKKA